MCVVGMQVGEPMRIRMCVARDMLMCDDVLYNKRFML